MLSITPDDLKTALALGAFVIALVSLYFTKVNWLQSNRPIVTAFITIHSSGNVASTFNLVIANTGNRPAVRVRLHTSQTDIASLLDPRVSEKEFRMIASNFSAKSEVPLLRNGEELATSFGASGGDDDAWLRYGAEIEISVTYQDLDRRKYQSKLPLKIYAREGFGGGIWRS